jgi:hypothetical protein
VAVAVVYAVLRKALTFRHQKRIKVRKTKLAQKLGQLQPFTAVLSQEGMGQRAPFGPT